MRRIPLQIHNHVFTRVCFYPSENTPTAWQLNTVPPEGRSPSPPREKRARRRPAERTAPGLRGSCSGRRSTPSPEFPVVLLLFLTTFFISLRTNLFICSCCHSLPTRGEGAPQGSIFLPGWTSDLNCGVTPIFKQTHFCILTSHLFLTTYFTSQYATSSAFPHSSESLPAAAAPPAPTPQSRRTPGRLRAPPPASWTCRSYPGAPGLGVGTISPLSRSWAQWSRGPSASPFSLPLVCD